MRLSTMKALAIRENVHAAMTRGELEARILDGDRAQAASPAEVSGQLRITAQAEADAWRQSADAAAAHDQPAAVNAQALARQMAAEKARLEAMNATYEAWSRQTSATREAAAQARAELGRRGHVKPAEKPPATAGWRRSSEAGLDATDRAIEREHQAAIAAARPWPAQRTAQAGTAHAQAAAVIARLQRDGYLPEGDPDPEVSAPVPAAPDTATPAPQHQPDGRPGRLDTLQARADEAAHRLAADNTGREARTRYTARLEREAHAQTEPAAERLAETPEGSEMEM